MRGRLPALVLLLSFPLCLSAFDRKDFDRIADFSVTLKTLAGLSENQARALAGRLLLLDGTVAYVQFLDPEEASFAVELELVGGEWVGVEDVKIYRCRVRFSGPEFFPRFPRRAPRTPDPGQILLNDHLLVVARLAERTTAADGSPVWVLDGLHARPLR
jgi:hypothetical protein